MYRDAPSLGLGLGLAMPMASNRIPYVTANRVGDWTSSLGSTTIADKSGNNNTATLYSGIYASSDGVADKVINADCSTAGSGNYYLTGKIKPSGTTQAKATISGSAIDLTGLTADVWQDFTTETKTSVTPSNVVVGWNGGANYSAADWSDVKLINASDGSVVARWQLNDSAAADLDGYPCFDSSGNGYHGTYVGCAGGSGETTILQTAGLDFNRHVRFEYVDASEKYVNLGAFGSATNATISFKCFFPNDSTSYRMFLGSSDVGNDYIGSFGEGSTSTIMSFGAGTPTIKIDGSAAWGTTRGDLFDALVDGETHEIEISAANISTWTDLSVGMYGGAGESGTGYFWDVSIDETGNGTVDHAWNIEWKDTVGSQDGTITGSPSHVNAPEDADNTGFDVLGNAITNTRLNNHVANLNASDATVTVPANATLDATKTVSGWVDYDGTDSTFLDLGTPTISSSSGSLTSSGFTSPTYHVNGVSTASLGSAGWKHIMVTSTVALATDDWDWTNTFGDFIPYSDVKVTADALTNYNAFKSKYGL